MSTIDKEALFDGRIGEKDGEGNVVDTNSIYDKWDADMINAITSSTNPRKVYYDSNIAFTNGGGSIVGNGEGVLAVPDLYGTLKGLNDRINSVSSTSTSTTVTSLADAYLHVTDTEASEHIIAPGNGSTGTSGSNADAIATDRAISLQNVPSTDETPASKFTVNADNFVFKVGNNAVTITDILQMIEELNKRTITISTNQERRKPISFTSNFFNTIDERSPPNAGEEELEQSP